MELHRWYMQRAILFVATPLVESPGLTGVWTSVAGG